MHQSNCPHCGSTKLQVLDEPWLIQFAMDGDDEGLIIKVINVLCADCGNEPIAHTEIPSVILAAFEGA